MPLFHRQYFIPLCCPETPAIWKSITELKCFSNLPGNLPHLLSCR